MEHISERILLWLLTHANARTKFRSVIRHQAIFEARVTGQIRCPEEARGWHIFVHLFVSPTQGSHLRGRKTHTASEIYLGDPVGVLESKVGQRHGKFVKGCSWSEFSFSQWENAEWGALVAKEETRAKQASSGSCHSCSDWFVVSQPMPTLASHVAIYFYRLS